MAVFNVNITADPFTGDSGAGGTQGQVPAPAAGDAAAAKYLHADGTWKQVVMAGVAIRTGSAIAFDQPAVYNSPTAPSSGTVTLNLTGAVAGTEAVACFNHSSEPTWPAGITAVGLWNNSALNVVRFLYLDSSNISAVIVSDAAGSYTNPETIKLVTADVATTGVAAVAIPDLSFPVLAGRTYVVELKLRLTGTATGGVVLGLYTTQADITVAMRGFGNTTVATNTAFPILQSPSSGFNNLSSNIVSQSTSVSGLAHITGTLKGGALDGVADIRFGSALAGQNATIFSLGSFLKVTII
jgi:hypothetical protein